VRGCPRARRSLCSRGAPSKQPEDEAKRVAEAGGFFLTREDAAYPERLLEIYDPPGGLVDSRRCIAAGAAGHCGGGDAATLRRMGRAWRRCCRADLANRRLVIISGMARGVDSAAHKGALDAGGKTVAVWGTGIDVVYPKENKKLAERIVESGGAIVSEFPLGTFPRRRTFLCATGILSGMSVGVLVVEAGEYSGTRITARCAMEQNRDVYAVPGNVTNKNSWGPNTLIKQGAKLTATWEDVWEDLASEVKRELEEGMGVANGDESNAGDAASLFSSAEDERLPEHERVGAGEPTAR